MVASARKSRFRHFLLFFFNDTATTEIYPLSLHDALPILIVRRHRIAQLKQAMRIVVADTARSEEHTAELQSHEHLVCRLLLDKKKREHTHTVCGVVPSRHTAGIPARPAT